MSSPFCTVLVRDLGRHFFALGCSIRHVSIGTVRPNLSFSGFFPDQVRLDREHVCEKRPRAVFCHLLDN